MEIDWEEILGAEGADMADVYNDSIPEEPYEETEPYDRDALEEEEEPYDDPNAYDEQYAEYEAMTHDQLVQKCIALEWTAGGLQDISDSRMQDIKTLMDLLEEHGIQVPEDVEKRYHVWTTPYNEPENTSSENSSPKEKADTSMADDIWADLEEQLIAEGFLDNKKK